MISKITRNAHVYWLETVVDQTLTIILLSCFFSPVTKLVLSLSQIDLLPLFSTFVTHPVHILQCAQFPPQVDLPCFLSFIILMMISVTMMINNNDTPIVPKFSMIQANIIPPPFSRFVNITIQNPIFVCKKNDNRSYK